MASSGTYAYAPDNADLIEEAFERCQVDPATLVARHFRSAITSINLLFADWANEGVRLFQVDEQTQTLTESDADYNVASGTLYLLHGVVRSSGIDTPVRAISREQYHMIPDKTLEGLPTQVYHDRATGAYYLFHVPENSTDVFRYYRVRRIQDAGTGQQTPDLPYHWFEAFAAGMAAKLAEKFAPPELEDRLIKKAALSFYRARTEDRERADVSFGVSLG
jgi:hypothetical protein